MVSLFVIRQVLHTYIGQKIFRVNFQIYPVYIVNAHLWSYCDWFIIASYKEYICKEYICFCNPSNLHEMKIQIFKILIV